MTRQRRPKKDASITMHMPQAIKDQLTRWIFGLNFVQMQLFKKEL